MYKYKPEESPHYKLRRRIYEIIDEGKPDDKTSVFYDHMMIVLIVLSILPLCFKTEYYLFDIIEKVTVIIFIFDYILRLITADFKFPERGRKAFRHYPFSFLAIMDLLSILPGLSFLLPSNFSIQGLRAVRIIRMGKLFKMFRLLDYSDSFKLLSTVFRKHRRELETIAFLTLGYIAAVSIIMFQLEPENFSTIMDAVYWTVITITSVGYGDLFPVTGIGRVIGMISSVVGVMLVAVPTGILTAGYMKELLTTREQMKHFDEEYLGVKHESGKK